MKAYIQENGLYFIKLPYGTYKVDHNIIHIEGNEAGVLIEADTKIVKKVTERILSHYYNTETKQDVTIGTVEKQKQELSQYRNDDGEWEDIKKRHEYELFMATHQAVYKHVENDINILFEVVGEEPVKHPYIIPVRKLNGDLTNTLYTYKPQYLCIDIITNKLKEAGFQQYDKPKSSFGVPKGITSGFCFGDGIKFSQVVYEESGKIKDSYMTIVMPELKKYELGSNYTGSYEELLVKYEKDKEIISSAIDTFIQRNRELTRVTLGIVTTRLTDIESHVNKLSVLKKDYDDFKRVRTAIADLISLLKRGVII